MDDERGFGRAIYEHFQFGKYDSSDAQSLRNAYNGVLREPPEMERNRARIAVSQQSELASLKSRIAELEAKLAEKDE